mgnify:FL=1
MFRTNLTITAKNMRIAIIGAGAAGCFAAINIKRGMPEADICVYEGGRKPLAKVAVTGGGRCNLTNSFRSVNSIDDVYPRGARLMKRLLREFSHTDAIAWFEEAGVRLTVQEDDCVFPVSQDAMEIVNTLLRLMRGSGVKIETSRKVSSITHGDDTYRIDFICGQHATADTVVIATGGSPRMAGLEMLAPLGLDIQSPVPSLFSLSVENGHPITQLMGTVVEHVTASITGTKLKAEGALLVTHWGLSGPAVLKLSSHAARHLAERDYKAQVGINWFGDMREGEVVEMLEGFAEKNPQKQLASVFPTHLNNRLWLFLLDTCGLRHDARWAELGKKSYNRMAARMTNSTFEITGRNRFKDEFVTCGGVDLKNINPSTLECRKHNRLYFAGEVLDVDAVTGGFNLQAAWTMGYVVAKSICRSMEG